MIYGNPANRISEKRGKDIIYLSMMEIKHRVQFGCNADELANKVLSGEKTATSSLYDYYLMNLKEEIKINEYASILDSQGKEKCIVKIERIEIVDFQDITEEFAVNEGDGCLEN